MLNFSKTDIILTTDILNDGMEIHYFDSYIMPAYEVPDHYYQNKMVQRKGLIPWGELQSGKYLLALSIPDLYIFMKEWRKRCKALKTIKDFDIDEWFEDYLRSRSSLIRNTLSNAPFTNYYDTVSLQYIEDMLSTKGYKFGQTRIDWTGFYGNIFEYTWMVEDHLVSKKNDTVDQYYNRILGRTEKCRAALDLLCSNMDTVSGKTHVPHYKMFNYVNVLGLQDGRVPNYIYIRKCLAALDEEV